MSHAPRRRLPNVAKKGGSAQHHSAEHCCSIATQIDDYVTTSATFFNMSDGDDSDERAVPVTEYPTRPQIVFELSFCFPEYYLV